MRREIQDINGLLTRRFSDTEELLRFYQENLPGRVGDYRLDEVGPIMSAGSDEEIEGYLHNRFSFNGTTVTMPEKIDWYAAPEGDLEWNGGFVRHGYFICLAERYEQTGDEIYARTVVEQMLDYIRNVPPCDPTDKPYLEYKKSTWRPFEVAGRAAENWPVALVKILRSKALTSDKFAEIFYSIYEHAAFLRQHHWRSGNHACLEVAGLGVLSIFFQEFSAAQEWQRYAVEFLTDRIKDQFFPDGYTTESSGAYHWVAMRNFWAFYQVAERNGRGDIFPEEYKKILRTAALAEFYQQKPDYSLPVTNDSNVSTRHRMQLERLRPILGQGVVEYRLSEGKNGTKPAATSWFFPDAKLAVMRSDWTQAAIYASFDMGPWGTNHMNEDQLNLELSAYGRNLLVNSGRWRYTTSPGIDWADKAVYFRNTPSYNSVLCDGMGQMPGDADGIMKIEAAFDYAKGTFLSGYGKISQNQVVSKVFGSIAEKTAVATDVVHTREVFFAKEPGFFIVRDSLTSENTHRYTQVWHMMEGSVLPCKNGFVSAFDDANLFILQLDQPETDCFCGSEEPFKGWNCPAYDKLVAAPEMDFYREGAGTVVFETLLLPVKGKTRPEYAPWFEKRITSRGPVYLVTMDRKTTAVLAADEWKLI